MELIFLSSKMGIVFFFFQSIYSRDKQWNKTVFDHKFPGWSPKSSWFWTQNWAELRLKPWSWSMIRHKLHGINIYFIFSIHSKSNCMCCPTRQFKVWLYSEHIHSKTKLDLSLYATPDFSWWNLTGRIQENQHNWNVLRMHNARSNGQFISFINWSERGVPPDVFLS